MTSGQNRRVRTFGAACAVGFLIVGCGGTPGSGLSITVHFGPSSQAQCAIVGVKKEGSSNVFETMPAVVRKSRSSIIVGVERTSSIRGRLIPYAQGYVAPNCTGSIVEEAISDVVINLDAVKIAGLLA